MHDTCWMSKAIYVLKVQHFRPQFNMTANVEKAFGICATFVVLVYLKFWFIAPSAIYAPRCDLNLMKALPIYNTINSYIATATSETYNVTSGISLGSSMARHFSMKT